MAQNLRAGLELRLPDGFLLLLAAEKLQRDPRLDDRPGTGPLGRPRIEYLLGGRRELGNSVGGAGSSSRVDVPQVPVLIAALRQLHHRCHVLWRRLRRHRRNNPVIPGPRRLRDAGFLSCRRPWRRLLLRDTLDPSPRGLEDEGLLPYLAGGAFLRTPTNFPFSYDRPGGAIRVVPTSTSGRVASFAPPRSTSPSASA